MQEIMHDYQTIWSRLSGLLTEQRFAVLSTAMGTSPYANLVAFAADRELKRLYFATSRSTRTFINLSQNPMASLLADNRTNQADDLHTAMAATAVGRVREVEEDRRDTFLEVYLKKHPALEFFVRAKDCAHLSLEVERYIVVMRFQNVIEIEVRHEYCHTS
jgi:nitroimidazol reductase NimA-like FMN-containing flavoprotein (pyridoxamine 5'-phosphate oxidase superfamily)